MDPKWVWSLLKIFSSEWARKVGLLSIQSSTLMLYIDRFSTYKNKWTQKKHFWTNNGPFRTLKWVQTLLKLFPLERAPKVGLLSIQSSTLMLYIDRFSTYKNKWTQKSHFWTHNGPFRTLKWVRTLPKINPSKQA
jgi:hypothetical protein